MKTKYWILMLVLFGATVTAFYFMQQSRLNERDPGAALDRARRELQPDEAAADDGDAGPRHERGAQGESVRPGTQIEDRPGGLDAVESHGPVRGSYLALKRLLRCHPLAAAGYDPVP